MHKLHKGSRVTLLVISSSIFGRIGFYKSFRIYKKITFFFFFLFFAGICNAQNIKIKKEKEYVAKTFRGIQLINSQTTEIGSPKSFFFILQHRFGSTDINEKFMSNFMGIDLVSNVRFAFAVPIKKRILLTAGRTRYKKHFDFSGKYTFFKQTTNNSTPFSAALNLNLAVMSDKFLPVPPNNFYGNGTDPFLYEDIHRLSYTSQLILARKFSNFLSLQVAPTFIHRNLAKDYEGSDLYVIPFGGQIKTGLFNSIIFEYAYVIEKPPHLLHPYSIGWQQETVSHIFQIFISSTNRILDFSHYTSENQEDILKGKFYVGFNLNKKLWIKKVSL